MRILKSFIGRMAAHIAVSGMLTPTGEIPCKQQF